MATKSVSVRVIIQQTDDTGEVADKGFDRTVELSSFSELTPGRRINLAASADDYEVAFTNASLLFVYSHTNKFGVRVADGETLQENLQMYGPFVSNAATNEVISGSILLTGNGSTPSDLEVWIVEKYVP